MAEPTDCRWLLLFHQIPPKPNYFRVKIWRRLQRLGAVAVKNAVYALPRSEQAQEDLQWVLREIAEGGGDATLCEVRLIDGLTDLEVEGLFQRARDADYTQLADDARALGQSLPPRRKPSEEERGPAAAELARFERRLRDIEAIDFFGASGREVVAGLLGALAARLGTEPAPPPSARVADVRGRTWVTRKGIHVDRIASAWLIRRFIDPDARFKYVPARGYRPAAGELRFDMFEAEFTHEGDRCTFEVLVQRFGLTDPALGPIAEIVHDIDLKDGKFARPDAEGVARMIAGLALAHREDEARLDRGTQLFEHLYTYFRRKQD
ncbi:MAG TPA: chromate resistance protein ChrB domain-containing protein [Candidatus Acidoferrum sp.]|nr:chromate resistance protein ChrB domain-containing protein [Candidatus Acidoferrum sp.]